MENGFRRAVVRGCACVITSRLTVEEIENYKHYHPDALTMVDEDDKAVFSIDIDENPGSLEDRKAVYSNTKTPDGKATITIVLDPDAEDKAELVRKHLGAALLRLEKLEDSLLSKTDDLKEEMRKIDRMIYR